ncbi:uncharacterized protein LOC107794334 isoform X2 [Nicotiana tabacum]|uniref:Uncharacterized protein LOC107794334 isoform X2 n=1 Tax=Nicotiana tabacum TaxID=4097 RepID=A0A1S4A6V8_TOBAC|nr:PREDICTED: uncharacterized protein LOC107794334 isoform X2 [Nicotiana tabacum]
MLVELICFLIVVIVLKYFFYYDDVMDIGTSDFNALFTVAERLEKLYGGKAHVGLQIPDQDSGSRQSIDLILVTKREAVVVCVKNVSGFVSVDKDGRWVCTGGHKTERLPDPVAEAKRLVPILESYLEQRGITLPEGYLSCKVICPNPNFRTFVSDSFPSEVITYDQWIQLKPETNMLSGWIKGAFLGGKKEMQESIHEKLNLVLGTAPMWDRLELKGNKFVLGEFLEFKGDNEDIQALGNIRRSKRVPSSKFSTVLEIIVVKGHQLLTGKKSLSIPGQRLKFYQKVQLNHANTSYPRLFPCHLVPDLSS